MNKKELRVLSLDGGGIRGLSTLLVLKELMKEIDPETPPKPCDVFDLICGTGTGGLVAIMLGRLQMTVEECIEEYRNMASSIFSTSKYHIGWKSKLQVRFSASALEASVRDLLVRHGQSPDASLKDSASQCATFVCATASDSCSVQTFPSWVPDWQTRSPSTEVKIWEAARATSAAPTFFEPITIGGRKYVDGGLGSNNPIHQAYSEALQLGRGSKSEKKVAVIVSIGAGGFDTENAPQSISEALKAIATDCEMTSQTFVAAHRNLANGGYFRFNVVKGLERTPLEEWKKVGESYAATTAYLSSYQIRQSIESLVKVLRKRTGIPTSSPNSSPLEKEGVAACLSEEQEPDAATERLDKSELELYLRFQNRTDDSQSDTSSDSGYYSSDNDEHFVDEFVTRLVRSEDFLRIWQLALENMYAQAFHTSLTRALRRYAAELIDASRENPFDAATARFVGRRSEELSRLLWFRIRDEFEQDEHSNSEVAFETILDLDQFSKRRHDFWSSNQEGMGQPTSTNLDDNTPQKSADTMLDVSHLQFWEEEEGKGIIEVPRLEHAWAFLSRGKPFSRLHSRLLYTVSPQPLHLAVLDDDFSMLSEMLQDDVHPVSKTLLELALDNSSPDVITLLLKHYRESTNVHTVHNVFDGLCKELYRALSPDLIEYVCETWEKSIFLSQYSEREWMTRLLHSKRSPGGLLIFDWELPRVLSSIDCPINSKPSIRGSRIRPIQFTKRQTQALNDIVTITGSGTNYEAATCVDYLKTHFGRIGDDALKIVKAALDRMNTVRQLSLQSCSVTVWASEHHLMVNCSEPKFAGKSKIGLDEELELEKALVWLCQALRMTQDEDSSGLSVSVTPNGVRMTQAMTEAGNFVVVYKLKPLVPLDQESLEMKGCWTELFEVGIVAQQPISHPWGHGLRLSFSMMTRLADVHNYQWVEEPLQSPNQDEEEAGGYVMVGFFTALIPIAKSPDGTEIQWHLECTGDRLFKTQDLGCLGSSWLKVEATASLETAICYLGWCDLAHVLLGTERLEYKSCWSSLTKRSRTLHRKGYNTAVQAGVNAGPIQLVSQGGPVLEFVNNRQRFDAAKSYAKAIQVAKQQVALVYDDASQRAWLVPMLSLMLHLCHVQFRTIAGSSCSDPIPFAQPSDDGSGAALQALYGKGDAEIFRYGSDDIDVLKLRNVLVDISANLSGTLDTRENSKGSILFGTELMDMITEPGTGSDTREVPTNNHRDCANSWLYLTRLVDCIGVCADLGPAIVPANTSTTCDCGTVQPGRLYLAAHLQCLELLLQKQRHHIHELQNSIVKLGKKEEWCFNPFNPCLHHAQASYWDQPQNFLQSISQRGFLFSAKKAPPKAPPVTGAVIFGQPPPRKLRKNP